MGLTSSSSSSMIEVIGVWKLERERDREVKS
jgi:hypothetical protein